MNKCQSLILKRKALPVFSTIPKFNLTKYNNSLLTEGKTSDLRFSNQYEKMQDAINTVVDSINDYILQLNIKTRVSTPFLHHTVMERRGRKGNRYYIYKWELYYDGLHASNELKDEWAKVISKAITLNERLEDSDEEGSPKRSWKISSKRPRMEGNPNCDLVFFK